MNTWFVLSSMVKADFLERTRRHSFLMTLCLVLYLGFAVGAGHILIHLDAYRGIYNSAWVGSLMAVVITFFLGLFGFFLVKNTIERDERTGVGQIIASTSLTRQQYLFGKWLSNCTVLVAMVAILAFTAIFIQIIRGEDAHIQLWPLIAPFLFIALPMMALVAALAVFFETVSWLKGGFGNLVYFFLFVFMLFVGIQLTRFLWLDVIGIKLVGSSMKEAARAAFPTYDNGLVLTMASNTPHETFVWTGLNWTIPLILQRLLWLVVSIGVVLIGSRFFNRFDPTSRSKSKSNHRPLFSERPLLQEETDTYASDSRVSRLTPLERTDRFHFNFLRLVWLECLLLVKGLKWYWLVGMAVFWIGCVAAPSQTVREFGFMLVAIWPVLVWSNMGGREVRFQTEPLIYQAPYPLARLLGSSWLAGVLITAAAASGVLLGRLIFAEPVALLPWILSVLFIPTLALTLGIWSRSSKFFEVVYPILWYLGPFNPQNQLVVLDYLGIHAQAPVNTSPLRFAGFVLLLLLLAIIGRRRQIPL